MELQEDLHGVERESLDRVDRVDALDDLSVALERVLLRLRARSGIEELDRDSALY